MCPLTHDTETRRQSHGPLANPSILQPQTLPWKESWKRLEKTNYDDGKYTSRMVVSAKSKEKWTHGIMGREHKIIQQGAQCSFFFNLGRINLKRRKKGFNFVLNSHKFNTKPVGSAHSRVSNWIEKRNFFTGNGRRMKSKTIWFAINRSAVPTRWFPLPLWEFLFWMDSFIDMIHKRQLFKKHFQQRTVKALLR